MTITIGSTVMSDGVHIAWDRRGAGPPLVLLHGFTDYRQLMEPLATRFAGWSDVINIDLRGHGESGHNADDSLGRLGRDVEEVCRDLDLDSPVLVGHSIGALSATAAAAGAGARAVVNIDQSLDRNATARRISMVAAQLRDPATFHATLDSLFAGENTPGLDLELQAELDRCAWEVDQDVVLGYWADLLDGPSTHIAAVVDGILESVTMPYLVTLGSDPGPQYVTWLKDRVPTATIEIFPGEAHFLHLAHPDRLVDRVRQFIR